MMRTIMVLDMSYTLRMYRERQLEGALESRHLGDYFSTVISVHPLESLFETGAERFGGPRITRLDDSHTYIGGTIGTSRLLRYAASINFILSQFRLVELLLDLAKQASVDVIRAGDPYYLGLMGLFLARRLRVPLVIRVPGRYDNLVRASNKAMFPRLFRFRWIEKRIERFVFRRCDLVAGSNDDNMRYALENGARPDRATVFRYGNIIHSSHWTEPNLRDDPIGELVQLGLGDRRFVATVTRLEAMKHVDDAIRALGELAKRGHDIYALIIGDGSQKRDLQALAAACNVDHRVIFAGNRPQEWIAKVLPKASVILSPHMGRALAEAALAGVPIVAYDYDWQRELILEGHTGCLVPYKDWFKLAEKMEFVLANPKIASRFADNARKRVIEMMNAARLNRHEQEQYSKLLRKEAPDSRAEHVPFLAG